MSGEKPSAGVIEGLATLATHLASFQFNFITEKDLQQAIEEALKQKGVEFAREADLGPQGVIDFLVGRLGIEIKIKGSPSSVGAQVLRYCESDQVDGLLLVTAKARLAQIPPTVLKKPVRILALWGSML